MTAEPRESSPPLRLLQLTDLHLRARTGERMLGIDPSRCLSDTLESIRDAELTPDIVLLTGDLVQDTEPSAYQSLAEILAELPHPIFSLPGNHDDPALMRRCLEPHGIRFQSRIVKENWQILCLDSRVPGSPGGRLGKAQLEELDSSLEANPELPALIALHHPPLSSGSRWLDTMQLEDSPSFMKLVAGRPQVRGVLFGHIHQELVAIHRGVVFLGTPSTCFQFKPREEAFTLDERAPGYRWIELFGDGSLRTHVNRTKRLPEGLNLASGGY